MRLTRLSPKPLFFGIVALGLPFAVSVGWALGDPAPTATAPPPAAAPGGAGVIGTAPSRSASTPVTTIDDTSRVARTSSGRPARANGAAAPSASSTGSPLPPLPTRTGPPVPTPTAVTSAPASPSATPSGSTTPQPADVGLFRR